MSPRTPPSGAGTSTRRRCWSATYASVKVGSLRGLSLFAVWDMVLEPGGVQGSLRISFPCPIVVTGGSNLPEGQALVGVFAYRLVSGH